MSKTQGKNNRLVFYFDMVYNGDMTTRVAIITKRTTTVAAIAMVTIRGGKAKL